MKAAIAFLVALCCLATTSTAWRCVEGPRLSGAVQIDAGLGQVVASTRSRYGYYMMGHRWYRMSNYRLQHVTVGLGGIFASGYWRRGSQNVYKYICGSFKIARGTYMKQVDTGGDDNVVGVTRANQAHCVTSYNTLNYRGVGTLSWLGVRRPRPMRLKYISCSKNKGCWGVNARNWIYYTRNVNTRNCRTSAWRRVPGSLVMIEASWNGKVFGVNARGQVFQRRGMTAGRPYGTSWRLVPMCTRVRHVSYDNGKLWVVTNSHLILKCLP